MQQQEQFEFTGYVQNVQQSQFPGLYNFEIVDADGGVIDAQGYQNKRDGQPTKVWPFIVDSANNQKPFKFVGNITPKGYNTVTFAFPLGGAPQQQQVQNAPVQAQPQVRQAQPLQVVQPQTQTVGTPATVTMSAPAMQFTQAATGRTDTTLEIEAAWAIETLVHSGFDINTGSKQVIEQAALLVSVKRRVAEALRNIDDIDVNAKTLTGDVEPVEGWDTGETTGDGSF